MNKVRRVNAYSEEYKARMRKRRENADGINRFKYTSGNVWPNMFLEMLLKHPSTLKQYKSICFIGNSLIP